MHLAAFLDQLQARHRSHHIVGEQQLRPRALIAHRLQNFARIDERARAITRIGQDGIGELAEESLVIHNKNQFFRSAIRHSGCANISGSAAFAQDKIIHPRAELR